MQMQIGRFARLTGLTVKALRHYDELGLLRPAAVDPETGYRTYEAEQVERAEQIRTLRRLELPLDEIAALLSTDDPAAQKRVLVAHQRRTALRETELRSILQRLQPLIDGKDHDVIDHRTLGVDLFNRTWTLLEQDDRTREDDDELLHCAHASAYHWLQVGTQANRARSEWQCSRVYATLGRPEPALHHARRCFELVEASPEEMEEFDLPAAYEALARAHAVAGDAAESRRWQALGEEACAAIEDADDREIIGTDLRGVSSVRGE
jgi:DNA-binding transcriptional MerR regulator